MKKYKVIKDGIQISGWTSDENLDETYWQESFGKPERWVLHKDEPMAEAYDEADVLEEKIEQDSFGVDVKMVKLKAEYTISIEDITAQVEQQRVNQEALAYLASTDWYIIREIDQGTPCPAEIKAERAAARARIVR